MQEKLNAAIQPKLNKKYLTYCADTSVRSMKTVVCTQPVALSPPSHISVMSRLFTELNGLDRALNSKWRFSRSEQNTEF